MTTDAGLVEDLRRLEGELVSPEVWQSRAELEARMNPDFIEIGAGGTLSREGLISIILGTDPGVWHSENFVARELSPTVALLTYRTALDQGDAGPPIVTLRASIWRREVDRWRMEFHQITRLPDPPA
jgi:hypothetical protein